MSISQAAFIDDLKILQLVTSYNSLAKHFEAWLLLLLLNIILKEMNLENIEDLLLEKKTLLAERLKKFNQIEQKHSSVFNCHVFMTLKTKKRGH